MDLLFRYTQEKKERNRVTASSVCDLKLYVNLITIDMVLKNILHLNI